MILNEEHIQKWSIAELLINVPITLFFSYITGFFLIVYLELLFNLGLIEHLTILSYITPITFFIIIISRKMIITFLINIVKKRNKLYVLYNLPTALLYGQILFSVYTIITIYLNKIYPEFITLKSLLLITIITFLFYMIFFIFSTLLNEKGMIFIEFYELNSKIKDFSERQKWLKKITQRISSMFRKGDIIVYVDELTSSFNMNINKNEKMKTSLEELRIWLLSEEKNDDFINVFLKIWPNTDLAEHKKLKWYEKLELLPYQHLKLITASLLALIILILNNPDIKALLEPFINKLI